MSAIKEISRVFSARKGWERILQWSAQYAIELLVVLCVLVLPRVANASDWQMWRHDSRRTALQTLVGQVSEPTILYSIPMGGRLETGRYMVDDINNDGAFEIILIRGGRAIARDFSGTLIWGTEPLAMDWILSITDFDGDGRKEVFTVSNWNGIYCLDATSGSILWYDVLEEPRYIGSVFEIELSTGTPSLYMADRGCSMGGRGSARVFIFSDGFVGTPAVVEFNTTDHGYWCGAWQQAGNIDGDPTIEIIALSHDAVIGYDALTGVPEYRSDPLGAFPYGWAETTVIDVDDDGLDEIMALSNNPGGSYSEAKRLVLLEVEGSDLVLRWSVDADPINGYHTWPAPPVGNVIENGLLEIVHSMYDPVSGRWSTRIISGDSETGMPLTVLDGYIVLWVGDLDGGGVDELLLQEAPSMSYPHYGRIGAYSLDSSSPYARNLLWEMDHVSVPYQASDWLQDRNVVTVSARSGGGRQIVMLEDGDDDDRADRVLVVDESGSITASRSLSTYGTAVSVQSSHSLSDVGFVLSRTDGRVELLDESLNLLNDTRTPIGEADLLELNYKAQSVIVLDAVEAPVIIGVHASGHASGYDASGDDIELLWTHPEIVKSRLHAANDIISEPSVVYFLTQRDDGYHLVFLDPGDGSEVLSTRVSDITVMNPRPDLLPLKHDGGSLAGIIASFYNPVTGYISYYKIQPSSGLVSELDIGRDMTGSGDGPMSAWDWNSDGTEDVYVVQSVLGKVVDGLTNTTLLSNSTGSFLGLSAFLDLDSDTIMDLYHDGSSGSGPTRRNVDYSLVWTVGSERHKYGAVATLPAGGSRIAGVQFGGPIFSIYDGVDGAELSSRVLASGNDYDDTDSALFDGARPGVLEDVTACQDLTGTGSPSFILGSSDGYLYSISAEDGSLDWSENFRAGIGLAFAADANGDDSSDIIVAAGDGHIHVVAEEGLSPPAFVYDTDGTFIAASPSEDLDELETSNMAGANWASISGATDYEYQIVRDDDLVVVPWSSTGGETRSSHDDLSLGLGETYMTLVRAVQTDSTGTIKSSEVMSDGFTIVDLTPPEISLTCTPATIYPGSTTGAGETTVEVHVVDATGLLRMTVHVEDGEGTPVITLEESEIGGREYETSPVWDGQDEDGAVVGTGYYDVIATAVDIADRSASASQAVLVCNSLDPDSELCPEEDGDDGDDGMTYDWEARGSGCTCCTTGGGTGAGMFWYLLPIIAGIVLHRLRRRPR